MSAQSAGDAATASAASDFAEAIGAGAVIPLIIIGCGGHGRVVRDVAEAAGRYAVIAVADDRFAETEQQIDGVWHGPMALALTLLGAHPESVAVIAVGANAARRQLAQRLKLPLHRYVPLIHPGAHISAKAIVERGAVVMPGAVVNAGARIGAHAIVNSGAVVEHDAVVGAYAHLSPNAAIAGAVQVGEGAHLGIGCSVIPGVQIGAWSVLGAGAAAVRNIPANVVAVGVPARVGRGLLLSVE